MPIRLKASSDSLLFTLTFLPADESAMAIACFFGFPYCISVLMLLLITFLELPFLSGMIVLSYVLVVTRISALTV